MSAPNDEEENQNLLSDVGDSSSLQVDDSQQTNSSTSNQVSVFTVLKESNMSIQSLLIQISMIAFLAIVWKLVITKKTLQKFPLFGYHPLVESLALVLLVQSILVLQPTSQKDLVRKQKAFQVHQILNLVLALPLFTAGAVILWYLHHQPGKSHFVSYHGILGTITVVWAWFQVFLGAASVWFNGVLLGGSNKAKSFWKWHRLSGYLLLPLFFITTLLGLFETRWANKHASLITSIVIVLALLVSFGLVVVKINPSKLPKPK